MNSKLFMPLVMLLILTACSNRDKNEIPKNFVPTYKSHNAKVTFIELGSVNCVPCRAMQPVMKSIENKYGDQINVIFYDVWTREQKHFAYDYKIKLIPTQVFLDENGKEFFRHEGFFPEEEIDKLLQKHGLHIVQ